VYFYDIAKEFSAPITFHHLLQVYKMLYAMWHSLLAECDGRRGLPSTSALRRRESLPTAQTPAAVPPNPSINRK